MLQVVVKYYYYYYLLLLLFHPRNILSSAFKKASDASGKIEKEVQRFVPRLNAML